MDPLNGAFVLEQNDEDIDSPIHKRQRSSEETGNNTSDLPPAKKQKPNPDNTDLATIKSLSERKQILQQKLKIVNENLAKIDKAIEQATAAKAEEDRLLEAQLEAAETGKVLEVQPKTTKKATKKSTTKKAPKKTSTTKKKASTSPGGTARPQRRRKSSVADIGDAVPLPAGLESCKAVVTSVFNHRFGFPFLEPVDPVALNIPDYFDIIKHPMDFGTIRKKLVGGKYESIEDFKADAHLVFSNACLYNHPGSDVYVMSETLREFFNKKMKPIEDRERKSRNKDDTNIHEIRKSVNTIKTLLETNKHSTTASVDKSKIPMTKAEMRQLSTTINSLSCKHLNTIIQIIQESMPSLAVEGEIEIDLNSLDNATLRKLEAFVSTIKKKKPKKKSGVLAASPQELARRSQEGTAKEIETVQKQIASLRDPNFPARPENTSPPKSQQSVVEPPRIEEPIQVDDSSSSDSDSSSDSGSGSGSDSDSDSDTDSAEKA